MYDKNLFAYCDANPTVRLDVGGYVWETVFDVVSLGVSIAEVAINPADPWAWAGLAGDVIDLAPFATGIGETVKMAKSLKSATGVKKTAKTAKRVAKAVDSTKIAKKSTKIHGNSLKSTKINYGYVLINKENKDIMKFGESINPKTRYSKKFLNENGYLMIILEHGRKKDIHLWQHDMNMYYRSRYGVFPPLNSRGW